MNRAIEAIAVAVSISATLRQTPPSVKDAEKPWGDTHRGETGDLVAKALGGDDGDILGDALVRREVESETRVVLLDDDARGLEEWRRGGTRVSIARPKNMKRAWTVRENPNKTPAVRRVPGDARRPTRARTENATARRGAHRRAQRTRNTNARDLASRRAGAVASPRRSRHRENL